MKDRFCSTWSSVVKLWICALVFWAQVPAFAMDWSGLEPYQETRSRSYVEKILTLLIKDDKSVREYFSHYTWINDQGMSIFTAPLDKEAWIKAQDDERQKLTQPEFTLRFGNKAAPTVDKDFVYNGRDLSGLKVAIDSNNDRWNILRMKKKDGTFQEIHYPTLTHLIAKNLKSMLEESHAEVYLSRPEVNDNYGWPQILQGINAFKPHIAIATHFNIQEDEGAAQRGKRVVEMAFPDTGNTIVCKSYGCVGKELNTSKKDDEYGVRFRYRLMHAIATGKPYHSAKLAMNMSQAFSKGMDVPLMQVGKSAFSGTTSGVQVCDELAGTCKKLKLEPQSGYIPGIAARNLAFHGIYANAVVHLFPNIELAFFNGETLEDWAARVAFAYFDGIVNYVENESAQTAIQ